MNIKPYSSGKIIKRIEKPTIGKPLNRIDIQIGELAINFSINKQNRVIGKIRKGDMLVTSKQNGVATASEEPKLGTVIGKALQSYDRDEIGEIEIVVGKL